MKSIESGVTQISSLASANPISNVMIPEKQKENRIFQEDKTQTPAMNLLRLA